MPGGRTIVTLLNKTLIVCSFIYIYSFHSRLALRIINNNYLDMNTKIELSVMMKKKNHQVYQHITYIHTSTYIPSQSQPNPTPHPPVSQSLSPHQPNPSSQPNQLPRRSESGRASDSWPVGFCDLKRLILYVVME